MEQTRGRHRSADEKVIIKWVYKTGFKWLKIGSNEHLLFSVVINIRVAAEHGLISWSPYHKFLIISFKGTYVLTLTLIFLYTFLQTYN